MVAGGLTNEGAFGYPGPIQVSGASVLHSGEGAPNAALGDNGDFYFDDAATSQAAAFYVKIAGVWTLIGSAGTPSGAKVEHDTDQVMSDTESLLMPWNTEVFDNGGWHDTVTNNSRLTVPAGLTNAFIGVSVLMYFTGNVGATSFTILKNGSTQLATWIPWPSASIPADANFSFGTVDVGSAGDYYELNIITIPGIGACRLEAAEGQDRVHMVAGVL